ncbi:DUF4238 domain-containing protein [Salimicrobium humidisoli]|uniref:DUF4238 domain-containing protein n=1 Tax=Salimicrobium humidisoli TaxID=2029857 RepID=A0ABX4HNN3_9BACI|nr:DUF4238 domain-containing protein [Salimicrobium humidisoli]PBB04808.1 hypothetical protein CKW00_12015 [Salimicrobium humidisoli]
MNLTKRQHYVPQCYLKLFSSRYEDKVDYFDKITYKNLSSQHVKNVAQQRYYYDFSEEFVKSYNENIENDLNVEEINQQHLEKYFSKLEGGFARALESLTSKIQAQENLLQISSFENIITEEEKKELSFFIALQSIRTPSYRELLKNFNNILEQNYESLFSSEEGKEINDNELFFYYLNTGALDRLSTHFLEDFQWSLGIINHPEQARFKHVRKQFVTDEFLISDNPVINLKHVERRNPLNISLEFALPLSPKHIIILRDNNHPEPVDSSVFEINRNQVRIYNEYQYRFSNRFVFHTKSVNKNKIKNFFSYQSKNLSHNSGSFCVLEF